VWPSDEWLGQREAKATDELKLTRFVHRKHVTSHGLRQTRNENLHGPPETNVPIKRLTSVFAEKAIF
jgi:hypothetical protein